MSYLFWTKSKPFAPAAVAAYQPGGLRTSNFEVFYDAALGAGGQAMATAVLATCEKDFTQMRSWFGGINVGGPFRVYIDPGAFGAYHTGSCAARDIHAAAYDATNGAKVSAGVVAEVAEVFMAHQNAGWNCGASNGEGLSRDLATALYPGNVTGAGAVWLDSGLRPNYVNRTDPSSGTAGGSEISNGCAVLFLNYLNVQFGLDWGQIVQAGGATLADTAAKLIGDVYPFEPFALLLWLTYPPGNPSGLVNDNPWPITFPSETLGGVVHVQNIGDVQLSQDKFMGTQGLSLRLEGFELHFEPPIPGLSLRYRATLQGNQPVDWVPEGQFIGTRGQSLRIEGFAIELTGTEADKYVVTYMAHVEDTGDTPFVQDGAFCGTPGKRVEGMLVHVQPK
ncbi:hypothetical protein ACFVSN_12945 [Kitasatospora sp. NPDC057904]|uniref:hypothetical protein n=1 Tax=Kitasatospora sp. NPDC057904 TaxID=3346275 RepID=UPI0036D95546